MFLPITRSSASSTACSSSPSCWRGSARRPPPTPTRTPPSGDLAGRRRRRVSGTWRDASLLAPRWRGSARSSADAHAHAAESAAGHPKPARRRRRLRRWPALGCGSDLFAFIALCLRKLRSCNDVAALRRQEGARDAAAAGARLRGPGGVGAARRRVAQRVAGRPGGVGRLGVGAAAGADVRADRRAPRGADDAGVRRRGRRARVALVGGALAEPAQRHAPRRRAARHDAQPRRGRRVVVVELGRVRGAPGHGEQGAPAARRGGGRRRRRRRRRRAGAAAAARRRRGAVGVRALLGLLPVLPPRVPLAPRARRVPLRPRHRRRRARVHEARASR